LLWQQRALLPRAEATYKENQDLTASGQKGFRRSSRKRMNPLDENLGFC
jgi:hypothetical protein